MKKFIYTLALALILNSAFIIQNCEAQWVQLSSGIVPYNNTNSETSLIIDSVALKYFPLAVGNVYKYFYGSSGGYSNTYKVRIVKDTIINSKRYFISNRLFPGSIGQVLRTDTASGNIYARGSQYCSYSPFEVLVDSLRARKGDTTLVCTNYIPKHFCIDTGYVTLFGNQVKKKGFFRYTSETSTSITYGMNFGIISAVYQDFWGMAGESLVGCYINGVLYGDTLLTEINQIGSEVPSSYSLSQNYPNPFNSMCNVQFSIARHGGSSTGDVKLVVYDIQGREVQTLVNEKLQPGSYETSFDGSMLNSGVYFYKMVTEGFTETKRMILIK